MTCASLSVALPVSTGSGNCQPVPAREVLCSDPWAEAVGGQRQLECSPARVPRWQWWCLAPTHRAHEGAWPPHSFLVGRGAGEAAATALTPVEAALWVWGLQMVPVTAPGITAGGALLCPLSAHGCTSPVSSWIQSCGFLQWSVPTATRIAIGVGVGEPWSLSALSSVPSPCAVAVPACPRPRRLPRAPLVLQSTLPPFTLGVSCPLSSDLHAMLSETVPLKSAVHSPLAVPPLPP